MGMVWDSRDALNRANLQPATGTPTGFGENLAAAWDTFRNENLSISGEVNRADRYGAQAEQAKALGESLVNPVIGPDFAIENISLFGHTPDYSEYDKQIDALNQKYPRAGFKTSDQIHQDITQEAAGLRARQANVEGRATGMGEVGAFVGTAGAVLTDPVVLLSLPFGAAASSGILRTALVEAGVGAASEAVIQPEVYQFKQSIESPYTLSDAALNVLMAGVGSGVGAAVIKGAGKALAHVPTKAREVLDAYRAARPEKPTARQKAAEDYLERYADMAESAPIERFSDAHVRTLDDAVHAASAGRLYEHEPIPVSRETLADYEATVAYNRDAMEAAAQDIGLDISPMRQLIDDEARAIAERVAAQEAKDAARPVLAPKQTAGISPENDDILAAIAKAGGLNRAEAIAQGIDPAHAGLRGAGIKRVFTKEGRTFDEMAELLHQHGYPVQDDHGRYTANAVLDALDRALAGEKVMTAQGMESSAARYYANQIEPGDFYQEDEVLTGTGSISARAEQARVEVERFNAEGVASAELDPLASEVERILERNPALAIPVEEVLNETGERVTRSMTAEQMLQDATRAQQIAKEITTCL